jgi:hypothetical protein
MVKFQRFMVKAKVSQCCDAKKLVLRREMEGARAIQYSEIPQISQISQDFPMKSHSHPIQHGINSLSKNPAEKSRDFG